MKNPDVKTAGADSPNPEGQYRYESFERMSSILALSFIRILRLKASFLLLIGFHWLKNFTFSSINFLWLAPEP
jgi:hypothetical protein